MLTFDELLEVLLEDGDTVTIEDYDDFFIIETTFEEEQKCLLTILCWDIYQVVLCNLLLFYFSIIRMLKRGLPLFLSELDVVRLTSRPRHKSSICDIRLY